MNATHVANPVRVEAHQIVRLRSDERGLGMWAELSDGSQALIDAGMMARYKPEPGDYHVVQDDGYRYINPREVFERKYQAIGQRVQFVQDRETAGLLRSIAEQVEVSGMKSELCAVVVGAYGDKTMVFTGNSGVEAVGVLALGQRIMLDTIAPKPTTTGETP